MIFSNREVKHATVDEGDQGRTDESHSRHPQVYLPPFGKSLYYIHIHHTNHFTRLVNRN